MIDTNFNHWRTPLAGALFVVIASLLLWVLIPIGIDAPKKVKFAALHPAYYPRIVVYCLLAIGIFTIVSSLYRTNLTRPTAGESEVSSDSASPITNDELSPAARSGWLSLLFLFTILCTVFFLLPLFGFPLTTAAALVVLLPLAGERRWWLIAIIAITLPMLLYLFFTKVANIPIPGGVLEPLLQRL